MGRTRSTQRVQLQRRWQTNRVRLTSASIANAFRHWGGRCIAGTGGRCVSSAILTIQALVFASRERHSPWQREWYHSRISKCFKSVCAPRVVLWPETKYKARWTVVSSFSFLLTWVINRLGMILKQREQLSWERRPQSMLKSSTRSTLYCHASIGANLRYLCRNLPTVAVVLDPIIARHLRPHQIEGIHAIRICYFFDATICCRRQIFVWMCHGPTKTWGSRVYTRRRDVFVQSVRLRVITDIQVPGVWGKPCRSVCSLDVVPPRWHLLQTIVLVWTLLSEFAVSYLCYNLQAGHRDRAEPLRWRWASNRQGFDRMPCIAGQCLCLFFSNPRYILIREQNWRAEFHKW